MIPDYQSLMLPMLRLLEDGQEYTLRNTIEQLADQFRLTSEERQQLLPSGNQQIFDNRVGWARTYLKKAGLIASPKRATFTITDLGRKVLQQNPERIDAKYLLQFPDFVAFVQPDKERETDSQETDILYQPHSQTPEEMIGFAFQGIRNNLASELLNKVLDMSPAFFERLVVDLLVQMGYGGSRSDAGEALGKTGDEGIDGTIKEDKLGLDMIYIQAKRWKTGNVVGRPELQRFVGALAGQGAKKGIFITTSNFTKEAAAYTPKNETKIVLIDGQQLAQYMIDYNIGCSTHQTYELKKLDGDFFEE